MSADPAPALRLDLRADPLAVRHGLQQLLADPLLAGQGADLRDRLEIVLAEVLNNIVEHAYAGQPGPIRLRLRSGAAGLHVLAEDEGRAMPPQGLPAGRMPPSAAAPEGGFGWCLIRALSRDLGYWRGPGCNRLRLVVPFNDAVHPG